MEVLLLGDAMCIYGGVLVKLNVLIIARVAKAFLMGKRHGLPRFLFSTTRSGRNMIMFLAEVLFMNVQLCAV